jgi:hypothetical protein
MPTYDPLDATNEIADGPLIISQPLQDIGEVDHLVAEQRYFVVAADYAPPSLSDQISIGAIDLYFVGDFGHSEAESGLTSFTRRWASVPTGHFDYQTYIATYPGIYDQRDSFTRSVTSQLEVEYFLCASGQTYVTPDLVPTISATTYRYSGDTLPRPPEGFYLDASTTPTLATYNTSVTTAAYSIVAEDSSLERYMGDIWMRTTRRVRPQ